MNRRRVLVAAGLIGVAAVAAAAAIAYALANEIRP